jgi:hypothetical protein
MGLLDRIVQSQKKEGFAGNIPPVGCFESHPARQFVIVGARASVSKYMRGAIASTNTIGSRMLHVLSFFPAKDAIASAHCAKHGLQSGQIHLRVS